MPLTVKVRPATASDAHGIAAVHVDAWRAAYRGLVPDEVLDGLSVTDRERNWRELAHKSDRLPTFVAVDDEGVVRGFCALATPSRDDDARASTAEIAAMYVDPSCWRQGVGDALMAAAFEKLRGGRWRHATLWLFAGNDAARGFYRRHGFAPDGAQTKYGRRGGEPELRMRRSLR